MSLCSGIPYVPIFWDAPCSGMPFVLGYGGLCRMSFQVPLGSAKQVRLSDCGDLRVVCLLAEYKGHQHTLVWGPLWNSEV